MPAHRKRPAPPVRMVELLAAEKERLLADGYVLTDEEFELAWERCWAMMVRERAWPHATEHRRSWRKAMEEAMKPEARACFVGVPTGYSRFRVALETAMDHGRSTGRDYVVGELVA